MSQGEIPPLRFNWVEDDVEKPDGFPIQLKMRGDWRRGLDDTAIPIIREFVEFCINLFDLKSIRNRMDDLTVEVSWGRSPRLRGDFEFLKTKSSGLLRVMLKGFGGHVTVERVLETIAHEMIHCKQWAFSELDWSRHPTGKMGHYWRGTPTNAHDAKLQEAYENLPWEKEAFGHQAYLVNMFKMRKLRELEA